MDTNALGLHATDRQHSNIVQRDTALRTQIKAWYEVQQLYCPAAHAARARELANAVPDTPLGPASSMKLWMPSMLEPQAECDRRLQEHEWSLRYAQANDALQVVRTNLQLRAGLFHYKDRFDRGQSAMTRSMHLLDKIKARIAAACLRYRVARHALCVLAPQLLRGTLWEVALKPLEPGDVRGLSVGDMGDSEGRRKLSWIWTAHGVAAEANDDERLHDCMSFFVLVFLHGLLLTQWNFPVM